MSRETKIGILAVIIIAAAIWGYKFIKGQNLLATEQFFYVEYDNVQFMRQSTPVYLNGLQVGMVTQLYQTPEKPQKITVVLQVNNDVQVPKDAKAVITSNSALGDKGVSLIFDRLCTGADCAKSGDYLEGSSLSLLGSMAPPEEMKVYIDQLTAATKDFVSEMSNMTSDPNNVIGKSMSELEATLTNLKIMSGLVNKELRKNGKVDGILTNVNTLTGSISEEKVGKLVSNATDISENIKTVDMKGISDKTNKTLADAQVTIKNLNETMKKADVAIKQLNELLTNINKGEGSLGKIAKDDKLYEELKTAARETSELMSDIQSRPYRYIPFKRKRKVEKIDKKTEQANPTPVGSN